jgi:hypothetical protein
MLEDEVIRHSTSPWNSPIILAKKEEDASGKQVEVSRRFQEA